MKLRPSYILIGALLLLLLGILGVGRLGGWRGFLQPQADPMVVISVPADAIDPLNDGRLVSVQGKLAYEKPPVDDQLGVVATESVVLMRSVEMFQWRESCIGDSCVQSMAWSPELIDASAFKVQEGHENPREFPFESARFDARGIHLGAFHPDLELVMAAIEPIARSLKLSELPANLAASASEIDGRIQIGNDALKPEVGDLRIGYEIIPSATTVLAGIQQSDRLVPVQPTNSLRARRD